MGLAAEKCVPCEKGKGKLSDAEARELLATLNGWVLEGDNLVKHAKFKDFAAALAFTNKVGDVAEANNHHPDFALGWGYVDLKLTSHDAGGITRNDFIMAAKIDALD